MATYVPNASTLTEPTASRTVASAAEEFRVLKTSLDTRADLLDADLTVAEAAIDALEVDVAELQTQMAGIAAGTDSTALAANLASTATGLGASLVGVEDSGGWFSGADGESVLAELGASRRRTICIDDYPISAVGDGVANDRDAIRAAILLSKTTGVGLRATPGKNYYLGTFPSTVGEPKFLIDFDGFNFDPCGATFSATYNNDAAMSHSVKQAIFYLQDAGSAIIGDFSCTSDGLNTGGGSAIGVIAVVVHAVSANKGNIKLGQILGENLLATMTVVATTPGSFRTRGITFDTLYNNNGYYGLNCAENGDIIRGKIRTNNCIRSYFCYGVVDHDVVVHSTNHASFTDILIKRYTRDTSNLRIKYDCESDNSANAAISFEHQNDTDDGKIDNVSIDLSVTKSVAANPTINFTAFTLAGSPRTSTASRTDNIHLRGKTNSTTPITLTSGIGGTNGENISRLHIQRHLLAGLSDYKRYIIKDGEHRYCARSNAAGGMAMKFNVSEFKFTPNWGLLTVWAGDNPGASSAEYIIRQLFVLFTVPSNGSTSIGTTTTIATQTAGSLGPTLTIANQTNTFDLNITVNNYTNASRQCSAMLDIFRFQ